jgi:hypothetical protein
MSNKPRITSKVSKPDKTLKFTDNQIITDTEINKYMYVRKNICAYKRAFLP